MGLNLSDIDSDYFDHHSLKLVMQHCPVLRELDLSRSPVSDEDIEYLAREHPFQLEHLALTDCEELTETGFIAMAAKMLMPVQRTLSCLNVRGCSGANHHESVLFSLITSAQRSLELYDNQEDNRDARRLGLRDHRHIRIVFDLHFDVLLEAFGCSNGWVCCPGKVW
eukprot:TRINITY_DN14607_c0_g1_i7.p1 TRINITY_DN14607_c0_g1~~TRINITY_DN14607_c0_g1_i7.p1  ORF type:complete len:177 (+),score=38.66 TRINITY_DN14607_c0_g1_i7:32-532(+)